MGSSLTLSSFADVFIFFLSGTQGGLRLNTQESLLVIDMLGIKHVHASKRPTCWNIAQAQISTFIGMKEPVNFIFFAA